MKIIRKFVFILFSSIFSPIFSQEALKSTEEEYYDFLSLSGIVERPTLGYRTLSDSEWKFLQNKDGSSPENEGINFWNQNNLGKKRILWESNSESDNYFLKGIDKSFKIKIYGPELFNSYNTAVPYGQNDGSLWQGKGYNVSFSAGARVESFGFELTLKPHLSYSQNKEFLTLGNSFGNNYGAYFGHNIDLVGRYGDSSLKTLDWGDTEIRYTWKTLTFGFGYQSPWLGPAWLNPMLGSNNSAPYPKFDAGLRKTKAFLPFSDLYLGDIEGRIWLGKLTSSDYFGISPETNDRMVTALSASYSPSFIPGFTLGLNRIFMTKWDSGNVKFLKRLFSRSRDNGTFTGNDEDQKFSIFADWHFPKVGFEVYGELGRDDFSFNEDTNPFHTAIYTLGVKQYVPIRLTKLFPKWENAIDIGSEFILEWNNFEMSQDFQFQWEYLGFYSHGNIPQGYTNKGQIIGAGTGSFGNSQFLGWKLYYPKGSTLLYCHRFCPNNNSVYSKAVNTASDANGSGEIYQKWYANFETYYVLGFNTDFFALKNLDISFGLSYINILHYQYTESSKKGFSARAGFKYNF